MSFTCPRCGMTSGHPTDEAEGYCGNCHDWTAAEPGAPPVGSNHALLIGELIGAVARTQLGFLTILDDVDGVHTDAFLIERPSGTWRVTVKPERVSEP